MFYDQRTDVPDSPATLRAHYLADFRSILEHTGVDTVAAETGIETQRLEALLEGETLDLSFAEAASLQACGDGEPDAETVELMATDHLLLGMSMAVLDVEALAGHLEGTLSPKEIQQKIERRAPMSFEEFTQIQYAIAEQIP